MWILISLLIAGVLCCIWIPIQMFRENEKKRIAREVAQSWGVIEVDHLRILAEEEARRNRPRYHGTYTT